MSFEIKERDLCARIGKLKTKSGTIETPLLFPVINPAIQPIPPKILQETFGCKALITNAYIIKKQFENEATRKGIHDLLDFRGVVMTDSGAYQILIYGDVEVEPEEVVRYQEEMDTDIATILDVPTAWRVSKEHARKTVEETLKRAKELVKLKTRDEIAWVGPVQGGRHLEFVAESAKEMSKLPFQIHALGSPTPVMEQYLFSTLVDMILTAKMNLPLDRPLHLFGAGHPFMFALAVALGCDLFDSAAYAIYARKDRYMTTHGTSKLKELKYFPCSCSVCVKTDPKSIAEMPKTERQNMIAQHNLYVSLAEIKRIKQAIVEGRLWEHLEMRAHSHPALLQALKTVGKYSEFLEKYSPRTKRKGLFFLSSLGLSRPEVVRHRKRLSGRYVAPKGVDVLLLLPQTRMKPFHKAREHRRTLREVEQKLSCRLEEMHVCTYAAPFGVVPAEIDEVYPLSQYETTVTQDVETRNYVAEQTAKYLGETDYKRVILVQEREEWGGEIASACRKACKKKGIIFTVVEPKKHA